MGYNWLGVVSSCYSYGTVSGSSYVGGLIGGGNGTAYLSYWDTETSGQSISAGGSGRTTAEMMLLETYRGWGFGSPWTLDEGSDYPRLVWESAGGILITDEVRNYGGGSGEPNNPYQIFTPEQLTTIGWYQQDFDKHFILMDDLNLSVCDPNDWAIIGSKHVPFTGTFEGDNRTISNFTYNNNSSHIGLIGYIDSGGAIRNLRFADPNIYAGFGWYVGGVVGGLYDGEISNCSVEGGSISGYFAVGGLAGRQHDGTISNSYATGGVSGDSWIGGLVGWNGGTITNCYTSGSVSGDEDVGGLVGESVGGTITNCCAIGSVSGGENVGGLVGESYASGTITNCYATGIVTGSNLVGGLVGDTWAGSTVTASFWDVNTCGQATSDGGTGKTTTQMQTQSTFTDAGWDFVNTWAICETTSYPRLKWQIPLVGDFICPEGINFLDFTVLSLAWGSEQGDGNWNAICDISEPNNNVIDELDLEVFAENWLLGR